MLCFFVFASGGAPLLFGYILPVKDELKMREFEVYRAEYCGLCKQLGQSYNVFSRFLLNYDLVLLALLSDALTGEQGLLKKEGCFANPVQKRFMRHQTSGLALAADELVLLSYHKLQDNLHDESLPKRLLYSLAHPFLYFQHRVAATRRPEIEAVLAQQMEKQRILETERCISIDAACDPTAQMCAALFQAAGQNEEQKRILWRLGLFAGQIAYLLDAAEDFDDDSQKSRYNVFLLNGMSQREAIASAQTRCRMAAGEIALCYNLLPLQQYKSILDNIFFLGLPAGIAAAGIKRTKRSTGHGQIEGV